MKIASFVSQPTSDVVAGPSYRQDWKGNYFPCITDSEQTGNEGRQTGGKTRKGEDFLAASKKVKKSGVLETGECPTWLGQKSSVLDLNTDLPALIVLQISIPHFHTVMAPPLTFGLNLLLIAPHQMSERSIVPRLQSKSFVDSKGLKIKKIHFWILLLPVSHLFCD